MQRQVIPEYQNYGMTPTGDTATLGDPTSRETHLFSYGFEGALGIAWFRRVKTAGRLAAAEVHLLQPAPTFRATGNADRATATAGRGLRHRARVD